MKQRFFRRRGATFTIMVLVTSILLLSIGGAFVDASRNLTKLESQRDQQEQAKEAIVGAMDWARASVAAWPSDRKEQTAALQFSRAAVALEMRLTSEGVRVIAKATVKPDVTNFEATALLVRRADRWVVGQFRLGH